MRGSTIVSLLVGLFVSGVVLAVPVADDASRTVRTPHGERLASTVHAVPEGIS